MTVSFCFAGTTSEMQEPKQCIIPECLHTVRPNSAMCSFHNQQVLTLANTSYSSKLAAKMVNNTENAFLEDKSIKEPTSKRKYSVDSNPEYSSYLSEQDLARFQRLQQDQFERRRYPNTVPADIPTHSQSRCYVCGKDLRGSNKVLGVCWEHQKTEIDQKRKCHHVGGCSVIPRDPRALFCNQHCNLKKQLKKTNKKLYDAKRNQRQCLKGLDELDTSEEFLWPDVADE